MGWKITHSIALYIYIVSTYLIYVRDDNLFFWVKYKFGPCALGGY